MWEAIESNRRRSVVLVVLMGLMLVCLGFLAGSAVDVRWGGIVGILLALVLWGGLYATAVTEGSAIVLRSAGAMRIRKEDAPRLWNVVEEMAIASGLPAVPSVHIIENDAPNAFAVGRKPEDAAVAITSGLASRLSRDELQGVIAHEISHIHNLDTRYMTLASVMMGSIVLVSDFVLRNLRYGGLRRRTGKGGGQAEGVLLIVGVLAAILAPFFAQLLYFACSRRREYLADASAARFTRYPDGLASALEKISVQTFLMKSVQRAAAPLFIVNPLQGSPGALFSTHPSTEKRIRILRSMGGRVGYVDYETAFRKLEGGRSSGIGASTLAADAEGKRPARAPAAEAESRQDTLERAREVNDLLARLGGYLLIPCRCGVRIKVPPRSPLESVSCPRCGALNAAPRAKTVLGDLRLPAGRREAPVALDDTRASAVPGGGGREPVPAQGDAAGGAAGAPAGVLGASLHYERRVKGWESFKCACGKTVQISPVFAATHVECGSCGRRIEIH